MHDIIEFWPVGIWIQPVNADGFWIHATVAEFLSVLVAHPELDVDSAVIRVKA